MADIGARFKLYGKTAAAWTSANPTPLARELCVETDTGKAKLGDGTTAWTSLPYWNAGGVSSFNTRTGAVTLTYADVTGVLGGAALSLQQLSITGTAGAGFINLAAQSSAPATPSAGNIRIYGETVQGYTRLVQDNEATTNLTLGRDNIVIARNTSGASIDKGAVVYVTGSTGNVPNVSLARADAASTMPGLGVVVDTIANNAYGQVMTFGIVSSYDTSAFATGAALFLSATVAGGFTTTRPSGTTNIVQRIATVLVSGVGNGSIKVAAAPSLLNSETGTNAATWTGRAVVATTVTASGAVTGSNLSGTNTGDAPCIVDVFTASGTWTKRPGLTLVRVVCIGGGGGGGSGRKGAAASARSGGGGGAAGGISETTLQTALLGATETVTVGAGGAGGASQTTNSTSGNNGTIGAASTFGTHCYGRGGNVGVGGAAAALTAAVGGYGSSQGGAGGVTSVTAGANVSAGTTTYAPGGGGGGGSISTADALLAAAAAGGAFGPTNASGGTAGASPGGAGGAGVSVTANRPAGGTGGGGGASSITGNAGDGGAGGTYGAGGGGGGASLDSTGNSGAGGAGAAGIIIVFNYF
jgi:hypothetical protein